MRAVTLPCGVLWWGRFPGELCKFSPPVGIGIVSPTNGRGTCVFPALRVYHDGTGQPRTRTHRVRGRSPRPHVWRRTERERHGRHSPSVEATSQRGISLKPKKPNRSQRCPRRCLHHTRDPEGRMEFGHGIVPITVARPTKKKPIQTFSTRDIRSRL